jgi:hypothetical protein
LLCLSLVDDILLAGTKEAVSKAKNDLNKHFALDEQGKLRKYVGCKIERSMNERWMKLTQPVMIQSFMEEFDLPDVTPFLPATPGEVLTTEDGDPVGIKEAAIHRKGTGKVLHMMKWSRHDILNRVREVSRFMSNPTNAHLQRLYRV